MPGSIPEHDGSRLAKMDRHEIMALLDLRFEKLKAGLHAQHDCPPNRISALARMIEVLNAVSAMPTADGKDVIPCWGDEIISIQATYRNRRRWNPSP